MGAVLDIPADDALVGVDPSRRFVCLVVLLAVRDGADRVRFEPTPDWWLVAAGRGDDWEEYAPMDRAEPVDQTIRSLTRRPGRLGWLGRGDGRFRLRLGAAEVGCEVGAEGGATVVRLSPSGAAAAARAGELMEAYLARSDQQCEGGNAVEDSG